MTARLEWLTDAVLRDTLEAADAVSANDWQNETPTPMDKVEALEVAAMRRVLEAAAQEAETLEPVAWIVYWDAPYTPKTGERCRRVHLSKNDAEFECRVASGHNSFIVPLYEAPRPTTTEAR